MSSSYSFNFRTIRDVLLLSKTTISSISIFFTSISFVRVEPTLTIALIILVGKSSGPNFSSSDITSSGVKSSSGKDIISLATCPVLASFIKNVK